MTFHNPNEAFTAGLLIGAAVAFVLTWAYYERRDWARSQDVLPPPENRHDRR